MGNVVVFPLLILSGAAVPLGAMPDGARQAAQAFPLTNSDNRFKEGERLGVFATRIASTVLLATLGLATAIAARFSRLE